MNGAREPASLLADSDTPAIFKIQGNARFEKIKTDADRAVEDDEEGYFGEISLGGDNYLALILGEDRWKLDFAGQLSFGNIDLYGLMKINEASLAFEDRVSESGNTTYKAIVARGLVTFPWDRGKYGATDRQVALGASMEFLDDPSTDEGFVWNAANICIGQHDPVPMEGQPSGGACENAAGLNLGPIYGFYIQGLDGKIEHINDPKPMTFSGGMTATFGPEVDVTPFQPLAEFFKLNLPENPIRTYEIKGDASVNSDSLTIDGAIEILPGLFREIAIGIGTVKTDVNWVEGKGTFDGDIKILQPTDQNKKPLIDGMFDAQIDVREEVGGNRFDFRMSGSGVFDVEVIRDKLSFPWPFSTEIASARFEVVYRDDASLANDFIAVYADHPWLPAIGLQISFDGSIIDFISHSTFKALSSSDPTIVESFTVLNGVNEVLLTTDWQNPPANGTSRPTFSIKLPGQGSYLSESQFASNGIELVEDSSDDNYARTYRIQNPDTGDWEIRIEQDTGSNVGKVRFAASGLIYQPEFSFNDIDIDQDQLSIDYDFSDIDSTNATVSFYYDVQPGGTGGLLLAERGVQDAGEFTVDLSAVQSEQIYVYAIASDKQTEPVFVEFGESLTVDLEKEHKLLIDFTPDILPGEYKYHTDPLSPFSNLATAENSEWHIFLDLDKDGTVDDDEVEDIVDQIGERARQILEDVNSSSFLFSLFSDDV